MISRFLHSILLPVSAALTTLVPLPAHAQPDLTGYTLSFSDEFSGPLDISNWGPGTKWIAHKPDKLDFGHARFGYTPGAIDPYEISADGILKIKAWDRDPSAGTEWRGGIISSIGRSGNPGSPDTTKGGFGFAQRYGYFEARIKCPDGDYVWPAFWLLTAGNFEKPSPKPVGEIDHLENWGSSSAWTILHEWVNGVDQLDIGITTTVPTLATEFHTYGILVRPDVMKFYIDGIERWQQPTREIFNDPLFVLADYTFDYAPNNGTVPQSMFIDYIRVYEAPPAVTNFLSRGTYSINGVDSQDPANAAAKAIDGNYATAWTSASGAAKPHEIKIDLGSAKTVSGLRYLPRQTTGNLDDLISNYEIRVSSNGSTWTLVASGIWSASPLEKTSTFAPRNNIRYVSLKDVGTGTTSSAAEINVISSTGGAAYNNLTTGAAISASGQNAGFEATKAIDGIDNSDSNHWAAGAYPQWIEVDLGSNKQIYATQLFAVQSRAYLFRVETKADGGSYQTVVDATVSPAPASGTTRDFLPVTARYVKLTVTGADTYTGNTTNIREFKVFGTNEVPAATLAAYYTLDNLTTGIQNQGIDGTTSNLKPASVAATPTAVPGIIGGGLSFDGGDILGAFSTTPPSFMSGNTGNDLGTGRGNYTGRYPFSISYWYQVANTTSGGTVVGMSQVASTDRYITTGVTSSARATIGRRNPTQYSTTAPANTAGAWHHVVAVFSGNAHTLLYVDGKLAVNDTTTNVGMPSANSLSLGAVYRSTNQVLSPYTGLLDDVGVFYNGGASGLVLNSVDAALINGLGRTGAIGLTHLAAARTLATASVGTTASIGGVNWQRVSGLTGAVGDWGGSVANGNAFIVTGASGNGIRVAASQPATSVDIGGPSIAGSTTESSGVYTVRASGSDIAGSSDQFRFVYKQLTGNGQITARVQSLVKTDDWAKAGVMMRNSLTASSRNVTTLMSGHGQKRKQWRFTDTGSTTTTGAVSAIPQWVRLVRSGDVFTSYSSVDGVTWTTIGTTHTVDMDDTIYVGLAVTAHSNTVLTTAVFDNVTWQ